MYRMNPGKPVYFVEGALDAMAVTHINDRDVTALGIPGVGNWHRPWAGYAFECRALVAVDDDNAGNAKVSEMARDLNDAGALNVERAKPKTGDWCDQLTNMEAFEFLKIVELICMKLEKSIHE